LSQAGSRCKEGRRWVTPPLTSVYWKFRRGSSSQLLRCEWSSPRALVEVPLCLKLREVSDIEGHCKRRLVDSASDQPVVVMLVESICMGGSDETILIVVRCCCLALLLRADPEESTAVWHHAVALEVACQATIPTVLLLLLQPLLFFLLATLRDLRSLGANGTARPLTWLWLLPVLWLCILILHRARPLLLLESISGYIRMCSANIL
jgi:hypothetical protein